MAMASERVKCVTGIEGLDNILGGGIPTNNIVLVTGTAGTGKTTLAFEFLVRGATQFNEPGVFMAFEESVEELTQNVASLGFDVNDLAKHKKIVLDFVHIERSELCPQKINAPVSISGNGRVVDG